MLFGLLCKYNWYNATKNIEQLQADIADLLGGSAQPTIDSNNTIQPIGHFVKH